MQPRAETDADAPVDADEMTREQCEAMGWEFCMGAYWARPQRLGWCRHCSALDDWKAMGTERVEELSDAELARHGQALDVNPRCPRLRHGKQNSS
eukprot:4372657-Pyramimonas_sp.AAC.1